MSQTFKNKRRVYPPDEFSKRGSVVYAVDLSEDETVDWTYANNPDGSRSLIGYTIIKRREEL